MFFTRLGYVVASLAILMAATRIGIAIYILSGALTPTEAQTWAGRYLGMPPANAIDQAALVIGFAVVIGILSKICRELRWRNDELLDQKP